VSASLTWSNYSRYDSQGRLTLAANPSAVSGCDDSYADLLHDQSGNYQYLNDSTGLVTTFSYYSSTTATGSSAGGVAGYPQQQSLQKGEQGTSIPQQSWQYYARSANGTTVAPLATVTGYRNTNGTGGQTTSYAYTWHGSTAQVESVTVTLPAVTTGQNGPGTADVSVTYLDPRGNPTWHKTPMGSSTTRRTTRLPGP
jgi:hypothetical protein